MNLEPFENAAFAGHFLAYDRQNSCGQAAAREIRRASANRNHSAQGRLLACRAFRDSGNAHPTPAAKRTDDSTRNRTRAAPATASAHAAVCEVPRQIPSPRPTFSPSCWGEGRARLQTRLPTVVGMMVSSLYDLARDPSESGGTVTRLTFVQ